MTGRRRSASSAETRWIVPRMSTIRTASPVLHRLRQRGRVEPGKPGVEGDVGRGGELRLEPDEVLGGGERVHGHRLEEELAREQGPVERALREDGLGHRPSLPSRARGLTAVLVA